MNTTLTCSVCLTTITLRQTEGLSPAVVNYHFKHQGWFIAVLTETALCPEHRGEAGALRIWAARLSRAQCQDEHDWDYMQGDQIAPHAQFCQVHKHYWWWPAGTILTSN